MLTILLQEQHFREEIERLWCQCGIDGLLVAVLLLQKLKRTAAAAELMRTGEQPERTGLHLN